MSTSGILELKEALCYDGEKRVSSASFGQEFFEKLITVNGFSKAFSMTGWRIGYAADPVDIIKVSTLVQDHSISDPNLLPRKPLLPPYKETERRPQIW